MKRLILLLVTLLPLCSFSQTLPPRDETGKIVFKEVVSVEVDQKELYKRALVAIPAKAKEVVKEEPSAVAWQDERDMLITTETTRLPVKLRYAVILQHKDGRYMCSITDMFVEDKKAKGFIPLEQASVYQDIPEKHYFSNGNLKPMGLVIQRLNLAHQQEIDKAIAAVIDNIKRTMASPTNNSW